MQLLWTPSLSLSLSLWRSINDPQPLYLRSISFCKKLCRYPFSSGNVEVSETFWVSACVRERVRWIGREVEKDNWKLRLTTDESRASAPHHTIWLYGWETFKANPWNNLGAHLQWSVFTLVCSLFQKTSFFSRIHVDLSTTYLSIFLPSAISTNIFHHTSESSISSGINFGVLGFIFESLLCNHQTWNIKHSNLFQS